jgi:outer membrane protein TolC
MASKQVEAAAARLAGTEDSLYRNIRMLLSETGSYARLIELYEKRIQPMRAADLESLLSAYAVGEASLGMALDSVRKNYSARIGYLENRQSLIQGLLELEYLTGETFVIFEDGSME